ncbi:uncharacterized protein [Rutidosis leptorrhynchoides]|uniref:uncharacterized protein n=1 Tax=Rutidosis leptorrhynchoides TaxID=125765 RepID=UPI003A995F6D
MRKGKKKKKKKEEWLTKRKVVSNEAFTSDTYKLKDNVDDLDYGDAIQILFMGIYDGRNSGSSVNGNGKIYRDDENRDDPKEFGKLNRAKNIAISMAKRAGFLAREMKSMKSDLCFMQERCSILEEENRRLRDGFVKGVPPEEDDLVRLQLEALLAEKSRLANDNANLTRENQCLRQLVEYHQLTSRHDDEEEDVLEEEEDYERVIKGVCLDFSSPPPVIPKDLVREEDDDVEQH